MAQTNVNIQMGETIKRQFHEICGEWDVSMNAAFTVFSKLMHDFACINPADMYDQPLADRVRFFQESKERESCPERRAARIRALYVPTGSLGTVRAAGSVTEEFPAPPGTPIKMAGEWAAADVKSAAILLYL